MSYKRLIKSHEVLVDRDIGEATKTEKKEATNVKEKNKNFWKKKKTEKRKTKRKPGCLK